MKPPSAAAPLRLCAAGAANRSKRQKHQRRAAPAAEAAAAEEAIAAALRRLPATLVMSELKLKPRDFAPHSARSMQCHPNGLLRLREGAPHRARHRGAASASCEPRELRARRQLRCGGGHRWRSAAARAASCAGEKYTSSSDGGASAAQSMVEKPCNSPAPTATPYAMCRRAGALLRIACRRRGSAVKKSGVISHQRGVRRAALASTTGAGGMAGARGTRSWRTRGKKGGKKLHSRKNRGVCHW